MWKEPDLTRDVTVRFDGMITVPLVGDVPAAGRTPAQLAETLTKGLERFIEIPRVTVGVSQANSARFYVVGQVSKSGEFPLPGTTTVLQALALAGGFKEFAKTESDRHRPQGPDGRPRQLQAHRRREGRVPERRCWRPGDTIVVP